MEVGAVKQAYNNEVILLKKNLNQARTQIIHKLTRKAKTLAEKKAPEPLKEKFKKKAESTVNEVLIMKKIKPRDLAKFIITHKGELKTYLNKPQADIDKACARLLLHKALQEKYKLIRNKFGDIPINDLLMSRQERIKLKKEQKELQKNKKKRKVVNSEGDWDVEDLHSGKKKQFDEIHDESENESIGDDGQNDEEIVGDENQTHDESDDNDHNSDESIDHEDIKSDDAKESNDGTESDKEVSDVETAIEQRKVGFTKNEDTNVGAFVRLKPALNVGEQPKLKDEIASPTLIIPQKTTKNKDKRTKELKNKNLNEKLQSRKFKKVKDNDMADTKIVDPFFITETGENYMSLAEPRAPDEVKEEHKQGNRKLRRAVMFGHVPKNKPRSNFNQNFNRDDKFDRNKYNNKSDSNFDNRRFNNDNTFNNHGKFNNGARFSDNRKFNSNHRSNYNDKNFSTNKSFNKFDNKTEKEVKLHPSWEAKKKQSTILPFQGKKIVFDET